MENSRKYFAFISYKREDEKWAIWLQNKLEHYKLPSNLNGRVDLPKEIRPIFRDKSELAGGVLADEIRCALEASKYLIVICSPRAAQSQWVGKEVQSFIDMGRTDKIIPFIIGGTAHAQNPEDECFPSALLNLPSELELLGINIDEMGRDAAAVKVVAQMFGLKFDALWQRYEREQRKKRNKMVVIGTIAFIGMAAVAFWMYRQSQITLKANWKMMESQARFVSEKAQSLINEGDSYMAQRLLIEVLPKCLDNPDRPYTIEAERIFRKGCSYQTAILKGHTQGVRSALFSPDGRYIVSESKDNAIVFWDVETGVEICVIEGHTAAFSPDGKFIAEVPNLRILETEVWDVEIRNKIRVLLDEYGLNSANFSPNGKLVMTVADDNSIKIWDVETGNEIYAIKGYYADFSPDGKYIVSISDESTARIWDVETGKEVHILTDDRHGITNVVFSPDGKYIVSESIFHLARVWDVELGSVILTIEGDFAKFSSNGKNIVSISGLTTVEIWDIEKKKIVQSFEATDSGFVDITSATFSPDGMLVVSALDDFTIKIWDVETGNEIRLFHGADALYSASFSPDGKLIVASSGDNTVRIWNTEIGDKIRIVGTDDKWLSLGASVSEDGIVWAWGEKFGDEIFTLQGHTDFVESAAFNYNGKSVISASDDNTVKIWDAETGKEIRTLFGHLDNVNSAFFSSDGRFIVSASTDHTVKIWDTETGKEIHTLSGHLDYVNSASFSSDGRFIVSASADHTVKIWDAETGKEIRTLFGHLDNVNSAFFSSDGRFIVSASTDHTVKIWDTETGKEIHTLSGHLDYVNSASFSSDGRFIVSASADHTVKIWDAKTGEEIRTLSGHLDHVNSAFFSSDGRYIVSASSDGTIKIWNAKTGNEIHTLVDGDGYAAFSPNGKSIVSVSDDYIKIWSFTPLQDLIDQTRERFKDRPLTPEERHQYYLE